MKPGIIQLADRVLKRFVPVVLTIAVLSFLIWMIVPTLWPGGLFGTGPNVQRGAFAALAVLVLGYPCALGMATPLAVIRGGGKAAPHGILLRSGDAFQIFPDVDQILLDKTGTITIGKPAVSEVVALDGTEADILALAASAEAFSEHPLADAVLGYADSQNVRYDDPETVDSVTGKGVIATVDGDELLVGKPDWLDRVDVDWAATDGIDADPTNEIERLQSRGLLVQRHWCRHRDDRACSSGVCDDRNGGICVSCSRKQFRWATPLWRRCHDSFCRSR